MSNNSDYKKVRTNLFDLLPNTLKTDVNEAFLENVMNRHLTKSELAATYGTIGKKSTRSFSDTRLVEPSVHRQGYQLQPLVYKKIATVDHLSSYHDILNKAERLGIDRERLPVWGDTLQFNFAPPIDYDKLVNWDKYYWYDPESINPVPQYITIKNMCSIANSRVNAKRIIHDDLVASGTATVEEIKISSLELSLLETMRDCTCFSGGMGWDKTQWDDSPENWISNPALFSHTPPATPMQGDMYFDESTNFLMYYTGLAWERFGPSEFSLGIFPWDSVTAGTCSVQTDEWSKQNKWLHQKDVPNIALAVRAKMPIIEYNPFLELNEWSYTKRVWAYRGSKPLPWLQVDSEPSLYELGSSFKIMGVRLPISASIPGEIDVVGDHTSILTTGTQFVVDVNSSTTTFTVFESSYDDTQNITTIKVVNTTAGIYPYDPDADNGTMKVVVTETSLGDPWLGFFKHWALIEQQIPVPVNKQIRPSISEQIEYLPTTSDLFDTVVLPSGNKFLVGQDSIRVYINGRRQYGTYVEGWSLNSYGTHMGGDFTTTSDSGYGTIADSFVSAETGRTYPGAYGNAIRFLNPIPFAAVVTIELAAAALSDQYLNVVEVRTSTDEDFDTTFFETAVETLVKYRLVEQIKTQPIQYPLFDIYNVDGTTAYTANSIFAFEESPTASVDPLIGRRIKITSQGKEYHFEQMLIEEDDGPLFCYKDKWSITSSNPEGIQTIWRSGIPEDTSKYIPRYVNEYRLADGDEYVDHNGDTVVAHVSQGSGDWEIPNQLFYNAHHENRRKVTFSEIVTHFKSIVDAQEQPVGFEEVPGDFYRLMDKINYGIGGTIHEYNDSYDTFISSMFQSSNTPRSVIDFAQRQYEYNLTFVKELCVRNAATVLINTSSEYIWDTYKAVADEIISQFEQNDAFDFAFGDSTTYNAATGKGVKNWIATLPFLKLMQPTKPEFFNDPILGIKQILHHDGHISNVEISSTVAESIYSKLLASTGGTEGPSSSRPPYNSVTKGQYWKNSSTGKVYRFNVVSIGSASPSVSNPIGSYWLNDTEGLLYVRSNLVPLGWDTVTGTFGDIDAAWKEISIEDMIASVILEIETRLFEAVPEFAHPVFNFNALLTTTADQETFVEYLKEQYFDYIQQTNSDPFYTGFDSTDPFTWNYSKINTSVIEPLRWAKTAELLWDGSWEAIYEKNFGTPYPHLMPWRLQGYTDKPNWWDTEYKDVSGTRRWTSEMWFNVKNGIVPAAYEPPVGYFRNLANVLCTATGVAVQYNFTCVNLTAPITVGSRHIGLDDLLPPYVSGSVDTFLNSYGTHIALFASTLNDEFNFGEQGPVERSWRISTQFLYGLMQVAFRMQPVRFLHYTFGPSYVRVAGLQIDSSTNKVFSHKNTTFHGDIDENNDTIQVAGLNQWYINFIRYNNLDVNISDFKDRWVGWSTELSYQTGSFINTKSLDISTKYFPIIEQDYNVLVKKTPDMEDYWVDALIVSTHEVGSDWTVANGHKVPRYDGYDWKFKVNTPSPIGHGITYYGVKKYPFVFNMNVGTLTSSPALPWAVVQGSPIPGEDINYIQDDTMTWFTGFPVQVSSSGTYPTPLKPDTTYYIIKVAHDQFKLANSYNDAVVGLAIDITTSTSSTLYVEEVTNNFMSSGGAVSTTTWKHYGIDKRVVKKDLTPVIYTGVDTLINLIDGYSAYLKDLGWIFNDSDATEIDIQTGRVLSWNVETERLIDSIYSGLSSITVLLDDPNQPQSGQLYHEVNPFRNNIWFNTERGIITNIYTGPYTDIRVDTTLYDQVGQPLPNTSLFIFRSDKKSRIRGCALCGSMYAQAGHVNSTDDSVLLPYTAQHLGGAHLFVDGYEHTIMFNKRTTEGYLIYDPFIGLSTTKFTLVFEKGTEYTFRPNVGGFYLNGTQTVQNIEHSVENMQYFYDTHRVNETADYLEYARSLFGYQSPDYLDNIDIGPKSKFVFWKGMIQNKGAVSSIKAFINARLFVDAKVDEFWAYKVGEYGNVTHKIQNDVNIRPDDVRKNELRLHFSTDTNTAPVSFVDVSYGDESRWEYFPDQRTLINPSTNFYFDTSVVDYRTGSYTGTEILFTKEKNDTDPERGELAVGDGLVVVMYNSATHQSTELEESLDGGVTGHYTRINGTTLKIHSGLVGDTYNVYVVTVNKDKHNPAKLIDKKTMSVISPIMIWHPAVGFHYHVPMKEVDIQHDHDPAKYNNVIETTLVEYDPRKNWNSQEVGTIWLQTSSVGYVPYYDTTIFPNASDRIFNWGKAADWSSFNVLQWTESPVPPLEWTTYVESQVDNTELDQYSKPSGIPMNTVYRRVNNSAVADVVEYSPYVKLDTNPRMDFLFDGSTTIPVTFGVDSRVDHNITNGHSVDVYVNGVSMGSVVARSVISSVLVEPPQEVTEGDLYQIVGVGGGDWLGFNDTFVEWNGTAWIENTSTEVTSTGAYVDISSVVPSTITTRDTITIIYPVLESVVDAISTDMIEFTSYTPYTRVDTIDSVGNVAGTKYYFWVTNKNIKPSSTGLSLTEIQTLLKTPSVPYMFMQGLKQADPSTKAPVRFSQVIIRGISKFVGDFDRFKVRFQSDDSLRDPTDIKASLTKKNVHTQWELFRKEQPYVIAQTLWDRLTEAVIGYKLNDPSIPVPSLERTLFDQTNGTATRIGMGEGQAFVDKELALNTIIKEIENPNYDLYPLDKSFFLDTFSFDTPENIRTAMDYMYNTLPHLDTNRIFFSCLHDALSLKGQYGDVFKTSAIALHGIRILETVDRVVDD